VWQMVARRYEYVMSKPICLLCTPNLRCSFYILKEY
jgi:hypothetical protein